MSLSTAAASGLSSACSMYVVQQQRKLCRWFIDMSVVWWGCRMMRHTVQIVRVYRQLTSASPRCTLTCVQEATCELASTVCIGSSLQLVTSATLGEPESHGSVAWDPEQYVLQHAGLTEMVPVWKLEDWKTSRHSITVVQSHCIVLLSVVFYFNVFFLFAANFVIFSLRATILLNLNLNLKCCN